MAASVRINSVHDPIGRRDFWLALNPDNRERVVVLYDNGDYHSGDTALADQARAELHGVYDKHARAANQPHPEPEELDHADHQAS